MARHNKKEKSVKMPHPTIYNKMSKKMMGKGKTDATADYLLYDAEKADRKLKFLSGRILELKADSTAQAQEVKLTADELRELEKYPYLTLEKK